MQSPEDAGRTAAYLNEVFRDGSAARVEEFLRLDADLRAYAARLVPNDLRGVLDPDGVVQEAWVRLRRFGVENVEDRGPGSIAAYLRKIVLQVHRTHLRRERAMKRGDGAPVHSVDDTSSPARAAASADPTPTSSARAAELRERIAQLPPVPREIWHLHLHEGWSFEAIAERLDRTVESVRGIYYRSREELAWRLGRNEPS